MHPIVFVPALVAAAIHVWIFVLESVRFMQPRVFQRFGLRSEEEARIARSWAYNQGFYNLFLAAGVVAGITLAVADFPGVGGGITIFACASMVAAGVVLVTHNRRFARAAAIQAVPPLIAIVGWILQG